MGLGSTELLIIFGIIVVVFGAAKLPALGAGIGKGISNFRKSMKEGEGDELPAERQDT